MRPEQFQAILDTRTRHPEAIAEAAARRVRPTSLFNEHGRLMMIAADHPARGALRAGPLALAMADRVELLDRLVLALSRPGVNGVLGTPDIIEDLLLLGALDGKVVIGSMNRGGLAGTVFEIDDRFTAYHAGALAAAGYEGGKMLLRIDAQDPATVATVEACARAVTELAEHKLMAMIEPFISHRVDGRVKIDLGAEATIRAMTVAAGLGATSAYTWLKVPVVEDMEKVMAATTLPALLLGGEVSSAQDTAFASWRRALKLPTVRGLVIGRSLLYPPDGDVAAAVDTAVGLMREEVAYRDGVLRAPRVPGVGA
jgi:DhnA family fructose-bisphosphate aldolase class Ia